MARVRVMFCARANAMVMLRSSVKIYCRVRIWAMVRFML
jgi:hypothetical protein